MAIFSLLELNYLTITLLLIIVYKVLDRLVRLPRIGGYSQRYVLVTGAGTGFGYEAVRHLDKLGCHVFAGVFVQSDIDTIRATCSSRVDTVMIDISKQESVQRAFEYVKSKIPSDIGLWGLVNNAGIAVAAGMEWLLLSDYEEHMQTNAIGTVRVTMTFMPLIKKARGRVLSTSSVAGRLALPFCAPYCMSKYAIEAYSDALRRCMRPYGVKVLLVEPGAHKTQIFLGVTAGVMRMWERTTQKLKDELGEKSLNSVLANVDLSAKFASSRLSDVSDAYVHALMARYPRARYVVGSDAKYFMILTILPEWFSDLIMSKVW